ncbi:hypothetical protein I4U23_012175 [Adineta vaga]|nr:hypothetical protein I4U23_012175 [Adineta vaga]
MKSSISIDSLEYPYPTYIPSKTAAGCVAALVSISLLAWFIQTCQQRFQPRRISFLLLISHMTIFIELIVRATVPSKNQNSKAVFSIINILFAIGQRMIIVGNFAFITEMHHKKSRFIVLSAIFCVVTSGILMVPANMLSYKSDTINTSYIFRELSAVVLLFITLLFYPVWYWSKTIKDMNNQALILISISSIMCITAATFNVIQSLSTFYTEINSTEGWFYAFQMTPIIFAHFTWSIFHPKRSLVSKHPLIERTKSEQIITNEELPVDTI